MNKGTDQAVTRREHNTTTEAKRVQLVDAFGGDNVYWNGKSDDPQNKLNYTKL